MTYELIQNASVEVSVQRDEKKRPLATIVVDDKYTHQFPHTSRVSKHLDMMTEQDLATRLSGGSFFFVENQLVDFRDGAYNGFVQSLDTIDTLMQVIGFQHKTDLKMTHLQKYSDETNSPIVLRKAWHNNEISVPGYQSGADFNSVLSFAWNPFVKHINSAFDLVRLICTNGMVGVTSFLNTKVPLMNRWEEHLDIAARQIQNKVNDIVIQRVQAMAMDRASVGDLLLLEDHALSRHRNSTDSQELTRLMNILHAVSPSLHLNNVYKDNVFENKNLAAQLPGHLTMFDAFNIATELRTHTSAANDSSDNALDKFANGMLFDREDNYNASGKRLQHVREAAFSSPDRAFYGVAA